MPITKQSYADLKEYWDFQRKVEYNKELLKRRLDNTRAKIFGPMGSEVQPQQFFDEIWPKISQEEYEEAPKEWVPENENYRFEWEKWPPEPKQLSKPKGRPVVLRAKTK